MREFVWIEQEERREKGAKLATKWREKAENRNRDLELRDPGTEGTRSGGPRSGCLRGFAGQAQLRPAPEPCLLTN